MIGPNPVVVQIGDEPKHHQLWHNPVVATYRAVIAPGEGTEFHQHTQDTHYVVLSGGWLRTEELGRPQGGTFLGHGLSLRERVAVAAESILGRGWVCLPTGAVLRQPHTTRPITHRLSTRRTNRASLIMLGLVVTPAQSTGVDRPEPTIEGPMATVEYDDADCRVSSAGLQANDPPLAIRSGRGAVVVVVSGRVQVVTETEQAAPTVGAETATVLGPGSVTCLEPGAHLVRPAPQPREDVAGRGISRVVVLATR